MPEKPEQSWAGGKDSFEEHKKNAGRNIGSSLDLNEELKEIKRIIEELRCTLT